MTKHADPRRRLYSFNAWLTPEQMATIQKLQQDSGYAMATWMTKLLEGIAERVTGEQS